jgi:pimeloyl-ACP methyl ester carboxylesterase
MSLHSSRLLACLLVTLSLCFAAKADEGRIQHVDIGGRKLTLLTQGAGGPPVVIEAGYGLPAVESGQWKSVCDEIARQNQVCIYDRAGLGSSDAAPTKSRTSRDVAEDLHKLLTKAKIRGPYVLVGHSIGGLHVRVFAGMYPKDVAGVVLVDSTHPDQDSKWLAALGPALPGEDPAVQRAREFLTSRMSKPAEKPEPLDSAASCAQARAAGALGNKPLAVVTHSPNWKMVPDLPDEVSKKLEDVSQQLQNELAGLSTDSTHAIATKAGHEIQVDEPQLVITAIGEVVSKAHPGTIHSH